MQQVYNWVKLECVNWASNWVCEKLQIQNMFDTTFFFLLYCWKSPAVSIKLIYSSKFVQNSYALNIKIFIVIFITNCEKWKLKRVEVCGVHGEKIATIMKFAARSQFTFQIVCHNFYPICNLNFSPLVMSGTFHICTSQTLLSAP